MKLKSMVNFASGNTCRRKALLNYFGEKYDATTGESDGSWCCDICSNLREAKPLTDMTIPIQKFLCCILRTKSRFGAAYVIDVLLGSHSKRILENGHNMISTFSIGHELTKDDWHDLVDLLLEKEYIQRVGEYNVLELTDKGRDLLVTREKVLLPFVIHEKSKIKALPKQGKSSKPKFIVHKKNGK